MARRYSGSALGAAAETLYVEKFGQIKQREQ